MSKFLKTNDVILSINQRKTDKLRDLLEACMSVIGTNTEVVVFRNQNEEKIQVVLEEKK
jgi:S1-C subfamily serine protease